MNSLDIDRPTSRYPVLPENIFDDDFHPPSKSEKKILGRNILCKKKFINFYLKYLLKYLSIR